MSIGRRIFRRAAVLAVLCQCFASVAAGQLRADVYVSGLSQPVAFVQDPSNAAVQYVVQQAGSIRVIRNGKLEAADFLNVSGAIVSGGEQGLLGLAFPPDYASSGRFYVNFTNPQGHTVVARFTRSAANPLIADPATRFDLLWPGGNRFIAQPFANHNGGTLVFGPDGYLYIGMGDGGSGNDPLNNAQNPNSLLGKMLRIDVNVADSDPEGYDIPPTNPFAGGRGPVAALGEIWAFGVRNPWKFSFDDPAHGGTGALVIADVGQASWEEIDYEPAGRGGRNYGWRNREGAHNDVTSVAPAYLPLVEPIFEYDHTNGQSIIGGYVYRGSALGPAFTGRYFFADLVGRAWSIALTIDGTTGEATASGLIEHTAAFGGSGAIGQLTSWGVDASGELYLVSYSLGQVFRISWGSPLAFSRLSLAFGAINNGGTLQGVTPPQTLSLVQVGAGATPWTLSSNQPWVTISPTSGVGSATITVSISNTGGVLPQTGSLNASITATPATGGAASAAINLNVFAPAQSAAPFGAFDTPVNGSNVQGSIAVTGWALDDVAVVRVELWRDRAPGETTPVFTGPGPGNGKIFIANPAFVSGARPDVEAVYGSYPSSGRAGWGYLLLTQGLWNQGNGPFTLYAFAIDHDGHATSLGSKSIVADNAHATKPFGAIDTPGFGAAVSGGVWNYGWALTPLLAGCTVANGIVQVAIDSGPLTTVTYGGARSDIAGAFSTLADAAHAGGAYFLDTTTLADGTHQIGWLVTDSCGRQDGIGSRFFTVQNGGSVVAQETGLEGRDLGSEARGSGEAVTVRRPDGVEQIIGPTSDGLRVVSVGQGERLELQLPAGAAAYSGFLSVRGERRALPVGSSLDPSGVFYWTPAAGFLGAYDLAFVARESGRNAVGVRVVVGPSMRVAVDTPQPGEVRQQPFWVAGWALDLSAAAGTGIDAVHVWAYPPNGASPIFLGVADSGDARPDVAATYGDRFNLSAYNLFVDRLNPGTYDLVVYPHRAATDTFEGAQVIRIKVR